jgi:mono/diheme cytochrome c family protein
MRNIAKASIAIGAAATWLGGMGLSGADPDSQAFDQIEKGRYLTTVADCYACHTVPEVGKPFAGARPIETPFGVITSSNLTPDNDTGIGAWTDEQFDAAVRKGLRPDGSRLYPAMRFPSYTKMPRQDVLAIFAYLKTVEPVHQPVKSNTLPFPFNIRAALRVWDALYFTEEEFQPESHQSPAWNRGAYLVQGPGHCTACHTPKTLLGGDKTGDNLRGFNLQGWFAPDITGDTNQGLGQWSEADITGYLKTGHNRMTAATGPMAEEIVNATSQYGDDDLKAIATYLKSLPQRLSRSVLGLSRSRRPRGGDAVSIAGAILACPCQRPNERDSTRAARRAKRRHKCRTDRARHAVFGWQFNDDQVAAVLTYIRNSWQTAAAPVAAETVGKARQQLRTRSD